MGDIIKAIEFLGVPAAIAIAIIGLFLILQLIGELCELAGKVVPELLKIRKYFKRKNAEKEETRKTLLEVRQLLADVNSHYSQDNITKRDDWMHCVDKSVQDNDK